MSDEYDIAPEDILGYPYIQIGQIEPVESKEVQALRKRLARQRRRGATTPEWKYVTENGRLIHPRAGRIAGARAKNCIRWHIKPGWVPQNSIPGHCYLCYRPGGLRAWKKSRQTETGRDTVTPFEVLPEHREHEDRMREEMEARDHSRLQKEWAEEERLYNEAMEEEYLRDPEAFKERLRLEREGPSEFAVVNEYSDVEI